MHTPYTQFDYILPPRTKSTSPFDLSSPVIKAWQKMPDAIAQYKLNGSRNIIFISPDDDIQFWNRHKEQHRNYTIPEQLKNDIRSLNYPKGKWNVFDSELMHFKTPKIKNTIYLYDVLVWNGEYLLGDDYGTRFRKLPANISSFPLDNKEINGKIFVSQGFPSNEWAQRWADAKANEAIEGFVLKRTGVASRLELAGNSVVNNGGWQCRVRKPTKNNRN